MAQIYRDTRAQQDLVDTLRRLAQALADAHHKQELPELEGHEEALLRARSMYDALSSSLENAQSVASAYLKALECVPPALDVARLLEHCVPDKALPSKFGACHGTCQRWCFVGRETTAAMAML